MGARFLMMAIQFEAGKSCSKSDQCSQLRPWFTQTVLAADLPRRPAAAPLLTPTPVYNWTGIYVGLNGGGGWGSEITPRNLRK
jgi:hypothetical protein